MKIFLEKPIAGKRAARIRQERFGIGESAGLEVGAWKRDGALAGVWRFVANQDLRTVVAEQLVKRVDEAALAVEVKTERTKFQFVERDVGKAFELEAQGGNGVLGLDGGTQAVWRNPLSR